MLFLILLPATSKADSVQVGSISFNPLFNGLNVFEVDNFTGSQNLGGFLSPVADDVIFQTLTLTLTCADANCVQDLGGNTHTYSLLDLGPGSDTSVSINALDEVSQAVLAGSFSASLLNLVDSSTFNGSSAFSFTLLPSVGSFLQPGDSGNLLDFSPPVAAPESSTLGLLAAGFGALALFRRQSIRSAWRVTGIWLRS